MITKQAVKQIRKQRMMSASALLRMLVVLPFIMVTTAHSAPLRIETTEALAGVQAEDAASTPTAAPTGPPLTGGDKDALRVAVSRCWNVGSLSADARQTTVVVSVTMGKDGKPENGSIRMISSSGGSSAAAEQAFAIARRAIIRCSMGGYKLPIEKYSHWREIKMTFNPEKMRIK